MMGDKGDEALENAAAQSGTIANGPIVETIASDNTSRNSSPIGGDSHIIEGITGETATGINEMAEGPPTTPTLPSSNRPISMIELPPIGTVTANMKGGSSSGTSISAASKPPILSTGPRPNIIHLPGSMLSSSKIPSMHTAPPTRPGMSGRMVPPGYGPPAAGGSGNQNGPYGSYGQVPVPSTAAVPSNQPSQKMELHDAFAYLDKVKAEFSEQPEVYNRFLQIMREFKANTIDANGVIVRVVQLFKGHKALIQGFNAFLPRTHHIDPVVAETGILPTHLMAVAQSMGISLTPQGIPMSISTGSVPGSSGPLPSMSTSAANYAVQVPSGPHWESSHAQGGHPYYGVTQSGSLHAPPAQYTPYQGMSTRPPIVSPGPLPVGPPGIAPHPPSSATSASAASSAAAMTSSLPPGASTPTNKKGSAQFVRAISYVKKIKQRFSHDPEIYKTFLASLHSYHKEQKTIFEVYMEVASLFADHPDLLEEFVLFLPENEAASIGSKLAQVGLGGRRLSATAAVMKESRVVNPEAAQSSKRPIPVPPAPSKTVKRARQAAAMTNRTAEESAFYERVKRYLGDKQAYQEFLKCLNLFCQDIIKMEDLVHLIQRFIGQNEELFGWFKRYIGYRESPSVHGGEGSIWRPDSTLVDENGELNLQACKKVGSYRIYPRSHILPKSSHRTAIGLETLNDHAVSCPVFNSEDSTFIASKKNQYEEALFRCEDERFEMDLLIEYNLAAIAVFEPLARKIELMSAGEKDSFTLGPTLGGSSAIIYHKAIRKIYGDKAGEVISGIQRNPAVAIPVVLRRLKQKDEEWRRIQRDWNKIWRDVHIKNYYKALDHQGIEFKFNDRRTITGRNLVSEIESIASERRRAQDRGEAPGVATSGAHLEFSVGKAADFISDLNPIIKAYVKTSPSFSGNDRKAILKFLGSFLPSFFSYQSATVVIGDQVVSKDRQSELSDGSASGSDGEGESATAGSEAVPAASRAEKGPIEAKEAPAAQAVASGKASNLPTGLANISPILLFANCNLYVLVRLVLLSLERLERMQTAAHAANGQPFFTEKKSVVASFLDLQENPEQATNEEHKGDFYQILLGLLRQLVCNNIDPGVFEERIRFMFGTAAYPVFTFDKLLQALVKQVQVVLTDGVSEQLIRLYDTWNTRRNFIRHSEYSARMAVEGVVNAKDGIIRVEYSPSSSRITMQLLDRLGDGSGSGVASPESRWSAYVDSFVKLEANPALLPSTTCVYLNRTRRKQPGLALNNPIIHYNMECKIAINTYKLIYVENTEDFLFRKREISMAKGYNWEAIRRKRFANWLQNRNDMDVDQSASSNGDVARDGDEGGTEETGVAIVEDMTVPADNSMNVVTA